MNALMAHLFEDCCDGNPEACPEGLFNQLRSSHRIRFSQHDSLKP
ncbi:hypothetical protein J2T60_000338 [Natronospira proteinivora]|uniref:Uncharacterized protein n=1 Tax=Natronospira proteinivora TaxID=1807133 RepID=A0ABT1G504_9GAMM|nr:hypothetical protein [Natronospira proteinivora]MCP1726373.1 hypothetical protein [Natronospira proteinivora]